MANPNEVNILRRELEKVLDRIVSDPAYRQQLLDNPRKALAGVVERAPGGDVPEVVGYLFDLSLDAAKCRPNTTCQATCQKTCGPVYKTCAGSCSLTRRILE